MCIEQLKVGDHIEGFYLLQSAAAKKTTNGRPFLTVVLADCTGTIEGQVWDYSGPVTPSDAGTAVKVRGVVGEYRGMRQVTVERIRMTFKEDVYDPARLVPAAPIDVGESWRQLTELAGSIADGEYRAVCLGMIEEYGQRVKSLPAGKSVHHAFLHGLLMHTLFMAKTADFMAGLYKGVVDRSLLMAGTILHDFAKCDEFTLSPLGIVTDYSTNGQLLGHLVMGAQAVARMADSLGVSREKSALLQHMILSHHGEPEYGAAVLPVCAESELLAYIDMIDSRMEIYRETFAETPVGQFSKRVFALDRRVYNHLSPDSTQQ